MDEEEKFNRLFGDMGELKAGVKSILELQAESRKDMKEVQAKTERIDAKVEAQGGHIDAIGSKLRTHVDNSELHSGNSYGQAVRAHWGTLVGIIGAAISVITLLILLWDKVRAHG